MNKGTEVGKQGIPGMMRRLGERTGRGFVRGGGKGRVGGDGAERQARARPEKASCARIVLKCCFLGNKESQMFEEGYHTTQRVCQHEKTGKRKG